MGTRTGLTAGLAASVTLVALATGSARADTTSTPAGTSDFKGVNWSDKDDNYSNRPLVLSGLAVGDDYATVKAKSGPILDGFRAIGANTVRGCRSTPAL